jgi:hypothetical protein
VPGREYDQLQPSEECVEPHLHSPMHLHDVVFNETQGQFYLLQNISSAVFS